MQGSFLSFHHVESRVVRLGSSDLVASTLAQPSHLAPTGPWYRYEDRRGYPFCWTSASLLVIKSTDSEARTLGLESPTLPATTLCSWPWCPDLSFLLFKTILLTSEWLEARLHSA